MNLVAVLIAPAIVALSVGDSANTPLRIIIAVVVFAVIVGAVLVSKRRESVLDAV